MRKLFVLIVMGFVFLGLAACGGGGESGSPSVVPAPTSYLVTGVAAAGSPIVGTVYLKDSSNPSQQLSTPINADGSFTFNVAGLTAPFLLKAVGTVDGQACAYYSIAGIPGMANINPLSHLAIVKANGGIDPASLFSNPTAAKLQEINNATIAAIPMIQTLMAQLLSQYGVTTTNFITGTYAANHTGYDMLFDLVSFNVNNGSLTVANKISGASIISTTLSGTILSGTIAAQNIPTFSVITSGQVIAYPTSTSIAAGGTAQFRATVIGATPAVSWSVTESGGGTISATGFYTAPSTAGTYHVKATSVADPTKSATATLTITASSSVTVSLSPSSSSVAVSGTKAFTANVTGATNSQVTWSVVESNGGTISSAGVYTAPITAGTYHVKATSVADPTKSATATLTITAASTQTPPFNAALGNAIVKFTVSGVPAGSKIKSLWFLANLPSGTTVLNQGTSMQFMLQSSVLVALGDAVGSSFFYPRFYPTPSVSIEMTGNGFGNGEVLALYCTVLPGVTGLSGFTMEAIEAYADIYKSQRLTGISVVPTSLTLQ